MSTIQRITGMNSGLDVDSLVKAAMQPYQTKIDKEFQNQKVLEYQQEQYKKIISDATSFYDKYFDILKTGNMMSTSAYQTQNYTPSDGTKVTAKGFAGADVSGYTVKVNSIASKATTATNPFSKDGLNTKVNADGTTTGQIYVNMGAITTGTAVYVDPAVTAKKYPDGNYREQNTGDTIYKQSNGKFLEKDGSGNLLDANGKGVTLQADGTFKHTDDGTALVDGDYAKPVYEVDMDTTVYNLNKELVKKNINITAKYSEFSGGIVLESGQMGSSIKFSTLLTTGTNQAVDQATLDANKYAGTDLDGTITKDGVASPYTLTGTSNTVTVDNVQFTLKAATTGGTAGAGVTLSPTTDVGNLKDKIVGFVNDYNTLLSSINTKLYETRDRDYMPLTDAQKKDMTDDQITAWEKKVQTGLLRNDGDLGRIASKMKSAMSSVMSGSGLYLEKMGITPVKNYGDKNGIYTVDEEKLTQALQENAANIKDLFTRASSGTDKGGIFTQFASTFKSEFKTSTSSLSKKVGLYGTSTEYNNTLTTSIAKKKQLISHLNDSFTDKENALYKKYSNLESALQSLNAQQSSLASMLGQG